MKPNPTSLENLKDIAVPPPVSWWPLAPGWWVVLTVFAIVAMVVAFRVWRRWRANAYRRTALHELQFATTAAKVAEILKRTALAAYPRTDVAALSGDAWCRWLAATGGQQVPENVAEALTQGVFKNAEGANIEEVNAFANDWIHHHGHQTEDHEVGKGL